MTRQHRARGRVAAMPAVVVMMVVAGAARGDDAQRVNALLDDVKLGPPVFYTSAAQEYLNRKSGIYSQPPMPDAVEKANRALQATIALGELGSRASAATPVLIDLFPRAVHATTVFEQYYAAEGTFEDWVMTKVMGEKNKFTFGSPFLSYEPISKCEQFLDVQHEVSMANAQYATGHRLQSAEVTVHIVFTFYAGACALSAITGQPYGMNQDQWRSWWQTYGMSGGGSTPATQSMAPAPAAANVPATGAVVTSTRDLVVGATYRFTLRTGDLINGSVESITDTSVVVEANDGNGYTFRTALVIQCELISLPARLTKQGGTPAGEAEILTFDDLARRSPVGTEIDIRIKNGQEFEGMLAAIDQAGLRLNVKGSVIPFAKDVIAQITMGPAKKPVEVAPPAPAVPTGPLDTLVVHNPKTDDYGRPFPAFVYVGTITRDYGQWVNMTRTDGAKVELDRNQIERVVKHSSSEDPNLEPIKRYAKPLSCPEGMVLVDIPPAPGQDRPFFKTCIDKYEFPNQQDAVPQRGVTFEDARTLCESRGKRLCTADEWQWACSGLDGYPYAYGKSFDPNACNTDGEKNVMPSGSRPKCLSKFGLYDMTGNVFEWVVDAKNGPQLMGGPVSKCQTRSPGLDGGAKPLSGLRCCKSN